MGCLKHPEGKVYPSEGKRQAETLSNTTHPKPRQNEAKIKKIAYRQEGYPKTAHKTEAKPRSDRPHRERMVGF